LSFIESLPDQFETNIGERGIKLSGGQRQRLSIARLLLQNPDIIIFDESTSSLDSHSEDEILKTIRLLSGSKTIITIAHRLSTVLISDRVALMEDGTIVAIENPSNMFTANGKFNVLFEHQLNSF
ncbi:MAG: ATP-binding cassette domain-containing protein, partial [Lachnospiraceae bacterium]|nr:ATP-binding cassette domain-containing protein [Lachnospiraceae bacterium]